MLARLVDRPFDRAGWLFEVKWDGFRAIAEVRGRSVRLYSRTGQPFDQKFAPVAAALRELGHDAVLDGEIVVVDKHGRSQFQLLQQYQKTGVGRLVYYVFDILKLDGRGLRALPLRQRKQLLAGVLPKSAVLRRSEHVERDGVTFFEAAVGGGLEGIMAKDAASPYREGDRGGEWLKIKTYQRQEAVIGGFTEPRGSRTALGALLLGVYESRRFVYIGHTGGGMDAEVRDDLRARLEPLTRSTSPFVTKPSANAPVHWVEPRLICEVRFQEWTADGRLRQPIFLGLRPDKPPRQVRRETAQPLARSSPPKRRKRGAA